jgi:hypothetical protein
MRPASGALPHPDYLIPTITDPNQTSFERRRGVERRWWRGTTGRSGGAQWRGRWQRSATESGDGKERNKAVCPLPVVGR